MGNKERLLLTMKNQYIGTLEQDVSGQVESP